MKSLAPASSGERWLRPLCAVVLVALACGQRRTVCDHPVYFLALSRAEGVPAASFASAPRGKEVQPETLATTVTSVTFTSESDVVIGLMSYDVSVADEYVFVPEEERARLKKDPASVWLPLARLTEGEQARVRLGFQSRVCVDPKAPHLLLCKQLEDASLIAELACRNETAPRRQPLWFLFSRPG